MGLDNYIRVKPKTERGEKFLREYMISKEPGYFRKAWNIRQRFIDVLEDLGYKVDDNYCTSINIADIPDIVDNVLKYFLIEENWEYNDNRSAVFSWEDMIPSIGHCIHDLRSLYNSIISVNNGEDDNFPSGIGDADIELEFIDSY